MRKLLLGLAGVAALGLGMVSAEPAEAQSFSISIGSGYGHGGYHGGYHGGRWPRHYHRAYYPRHHYYPRVYRRVAYPIYATPAYYGPRCVTRVTQRWDGWRHVSIRKRTCY
jgi:hypothetical protein